MAWGRQFSIGCLLSGCYGAFVCRPLLDAAQVEDGPACPARPNALCCSADFVCADGTFVVAVVDVFVGASGDIGRSRLGALGELRLLLARWAAGPLGRLWSPGCEFRRIGLQAGCLSGNGGRSLCRPGVQQAWVVGSSPSSGTGGLRLVVGVLLRGLPASSPSPSPSASPPSSSRCVGLWFLRRPCLLLLLLLLLWRRWAWALAMAWTWTARGLRVACWRSIAGRLRRHGGGCANRRGGGWRYFGVHSDRDKTSIFCTWLAGGAGTGAMMSHHECRSSLAAALLSERVGRSRTVLEQQTAESVLDAGRWSLAAGRWTFRSFSRHRQCASSPPGETPARLAQRPRHARRRASSFEPRAPMPQVDGRATIHHIRTHGKVSRRRPRLGLAALSPRLPQHLALLPLLHRRVRACCPPPPPAASRLTTPA